MNIVVFDDLPEGGAKRVVFEQVKRLSGNHAIDYITNTLSTSFPFQKYAHEIFKFDLDLQQYRGGLRPFQEFSLYTKIVPTYRKINQLINRIDPDVVLVHPSRLTQLPDCTQLQNPCCILNYSPQSLQSNRVAVLISNTQKDTQNFYTRL